MAVINSSTNKTSHKKSWGHILAWIFAGLVVLLAAALVGAYFFLQTDKFHNYALRKIDDAAFQATGARTQIGSLDLSLSTLTARLHNIVLHGTEPASAPPLLSADELTVGIKIDSVFSHKFHLSELLIQHPVAHIYVDPKGATNIPATPPSQSSSNTSIFDLAIRHFALTNGEINYNDQKTPLDANLYNLQTQVTFDSLATRYSGTFSYSNGQLAYANYKPWPHSFRMQFAATPTQFSLQSAEFLLASSTIHLHADVANFSAPTATGDYEIRVHSQDFAAFSPSVKPAGDVHLAGKINYQNQPNQPILRAITLTGNLESNGLSAVSPDARLEIRKLLAHFQLANGQFQAHNVEADLLGGRVLADADIRNLDTTPISDIRAAIHSVSLRAAQQSIRQARRQQVNVSGTLDGTLSANWTGSIQSLRARTDLTVRADASTKSKNAQSKNSSQLPVQAIIHALYDSPSNTLTLHQTNVQLPSLNLTAEGQVSQRSKLDIHAQASDLHQLIALATSFYPTQSAPPALSGTANLNVTVTGSTEKPQIAGQLQAQNLQVQGSAWKEATASFNASPSQFTLSNATLVNAKQGRASASAEVSLRRWSYSPDSPIRADLSAQQLSLADLQRLANVQYPVSGNLSAKLSLAGSQNNPSGSGSLAIASARAYDEPIQNLALNFQAANGSVVSTLNIAAKAGSATANLDYTPKTRAYKLQLTSQPISLQNVHTLQAKGPVAGTLTLSANGVGTIDDPQLSANVHLANLQLQQKSFGQLAADLQLANHHANLDLNSQLSQASLHARAQVDLTGDYQTDASIDTNAIDIGPLLTTFSTALPEGFQGRTELHATVKGPLKDKTRLEAHVTIPALSASYQQLQIAAGSPIHADYVNSVLTLQPAEIRGTDTSLRLQGSIPFAGSSVPSFTAQGSVDARILQIFQPNLQSSGKVSLDVRAAGSPSNPAIQGNIQVQNISLITTDAPLGVENMNGTLAISNDRVQVSTLTAQVGGGQVSMGGAIIYRPQVQFALALQGKQVRLRYPQGLRTLLDSNIALSGNMQSSTLNGRVLIDSLSFTPDFDLSTFSDQFSSGITSPTPPGFADTIKLAIAVQSKQNLSANSSQVSLEGAVDLNVTGTAADPVITGRTDLTSGELFYRSNRYQLERGVISFANPNETTPDLNVAVSTTVEQYKLTINLRGPLDRLTTSYVSDPPLSSADIIHLVAFGNTTSESAASSASQSTDSMLASGALGAGVTSGVQKLAGLSSLQIDPLLGGDNQNPGARIALQQRVTKNFLFTFSTDVSQPGQELVQGDYQINPRWSVTVTRDQLGGVSVAGRLHAKF